MGWIKHLGLNNYYLGLFCIMGLNKYCYLGFLFLSMVNWVYYIRVFTNYLRVFRIFFFVKDIYIKFFFFL
jgi:hypothetical protein